MFPNSVLTGDMNWPSASNMLSLNTLYAACKNPTPFSAPLNSFAIWMTSHLYLLSLLKHILYWIFLLFSPLQGESALRVHYGHRGQDSLSVCIWSMNSTLNYLSLPVKVTQLSLEAYRVRWDTPHPYRVALMCDPAHTSGTVQELFPFL